MAVPIDVQGDNVEPLLEVGPILGIDTTTAPFRLNPNNVVDSLNITPNETYGSYVTALGRSRVFTLPGKINGITKFVRPGHVDTYIFAVDVGGAGTLYYGPYGGPYNPLSLPEALTPGLNTQFVFAQKWCFVCNGVDTPLKIDLNLVVTFWGIVAPTTAPSLAASGVSLMTGTYRYCVTFGSADCESSQGEISAPITVTNQGVQLSAIPVSIDPQVTQRNIYREGGTIGEFLLIHTINDNTTTTYLDTLSDANVVGQQLTIFRDPPLPFTYIATHQERIWGWGTPSDPSIVYYSNLNEPYAFNYDTGTLPVGENSFNDVATGMNSLGSVLLLNKRRTLYAVYGSTDADFIAVKQSDTGCRSGKTVASLDGTAAWLNRRGVWFSTGSAPQIASDGTYQQSNIKSVIDSLTEDDLNAATGFWYDRMYHISFPTLNKTYFFDTRTTSWWALGWATDQIYTDPESPQDVVASNLQTIGAFDQWFTGGTDIGMPISGYLKSRISDAGDSSTEKIIRYGEIVAPLQTAMAYLTAIANPGNQQYQNQIEMNLSQGTIRHQESWPRAIRGSEFQLELRTVSTTQLEIQKITLYGYVDRKLVQVSTQAAAQ